VIPLSDHIENGTPIKNVEASPRQIYDKLYKMQKRKQMPHKVDGLIFQTVKSVHHVIITIIIK